MEVEQACQMLKRGECSQISPKHGPTRGGWGDRAGSKRGAGSRPLHIRGSRCVGFSLSLRDALGIHDDEYPSKRTTSSVDFYAPDRGHRRFLAL
jgi:hypothetical protein